MVDFSWASLPAKRLVTIAEALNERYASMRSIDFSYNKLSPEDDTLIEDNYVIEFIQKMCEFFKEALVINHLKLSGMFSIRLQD
jgi:hypothetical protein